FVQRNGLRPVLHSFPTRRSSDLVKATTPARTLQDLCSLQAPLFVGLIAMLVGSTLQDDIALTTRQLVAKGHDILGMVPGMNFERSAHEKTCPQSAAAPQGPSPVQ